MEGDKIRKVKTALNSWWMEKQLKIFSTAASIACKAARQNFLSSPIFLGLFLLSALQKCQLLAELIKKLMMWQTGCKGICLGASNLPPLTPIA